MKQTQHSTKQPVSDADIKAAKKDRTGQKRNEKAISLLNTVQHRAEQFSLYGL